MSGTISGTSPTRVIEERVRRMVTDASRLVVGADPQTSPLVAILGPSDSSVVVGGSPKSSNTRGERGLVPTNPAPMTRPTSAVRSYQVDPITVRPPRWGDRPSGPGAETFPTP